jgi:hypothetical protein
MLDRESHTSEESRGDLDPPQWMNEPGLGGFTDEEFFQELKTVIHSREVRALRKVIWILIKHRFHSVPHDFENHLVGTNDPEKLLRVFRKALTVEKIHYLYLYF